MKRIVSILAFLLPFVAFADNVSSDQARKVAETFFSSHATRAVTPTLNLKWTGSVQTRTSSDPAFYVFDNSAGGFVIVAGDDRVEPILGYSTEGEFKVDGMPANVQYWFDYLQEGIAYLRTNRIVPSAKVKAQWKAFDNGTASRISAAASVTRDLETADWNQYEPFNLKASEWCNFGSGVTVYTGCVATATAIIMRHHQYPSKGTGTIGGYSYESEKKDNRTINAYSLGHTYDWNNMPTDNGRNWTTDQQNAVAQLMLDCGVMNEMEYGIYQPQDKRESGSGAVTRKSPKELVEHMGYDKGWEALDRVYYQRDEWVSRIIASIDAGCPVLFSGRGTGGHAFVLDGYDSDGKIQINWGWGGYENGYYTVPDFGDYKEEQTAFVNIKPDKGGNEVPTFIYQSGMRFSAGPTYTSDNTFEMKIFTAQVGNGGRSLFEGKIVLAHADKEDNIKSVITTISQSLKSGSYFYNLEIPFTVNQNKIAKGDKIKWFYQHEGSDVYLPAKYNLEDGSVDGLPMPDTEDTFDIEEGTSAEYFPVEKKLVISSHAGLKYVLKKSEGSTVDSGLAFSNGVLTIDLKTLASGEYTLMLMVGDKSKELIFTVGE